MRKPPFQAVACIAIKLYTYFTPETQICPEKLQREPGQYGGWSIWMPSRAENWLHAAGDCGRAGSARRGVQGASCPLRNIANSDKKTDEKECHVNRPS